MSESLKNSTKSENQIQGETFLLLPSKFSVSFFNEISEEKNRLFDLELMMKPERSEKNENLNLKKGFYYT